MVFCRSRSDYRRQQVVELSELEGGTGEKNEESDDDLVSESKIKSVRKKHNMNALNDSPTDDIPMNTYASGFPNGSNSHEIYSGRNDNSSRRSSQISHQSFTQEDVFPSNSHPHIRFAYSDFEASLYVPSRSSRLNSHNSLVRDENDPLYKKIDNTRRDAVMTLSEKREKKAELVHKESLKPKEKTIGIYKMAEYSISMSFQKSKNAITGLSYTMELWYSSLKLIEGNFGSGVASYFKFLRWLFLLNLVTLIISFSFLVIPQLLARFFLSSNEVPDVTEIGGTHMEKTFSDPPDMNGTLPPPLTAAALIQRSNPYRENNEFSVTDLFTGEGFLTATTMYYGFYTNGSLELFEGYPYDLPNAYFISMAVCYVTILVTVSVSMARSYRKTFIETRGAYQKVSLALKVFSGWDFSVATFNAAELNKKRLYNEIKEALNEEEFKDRDSSCLSRFTNFVVQFTLNIIFFFLLAGIALLMWDLLGRHSAYLENNSAGHGNTMTMAMITSLIMNMLPIGFSWVVRYEDYRNPRTALYVTLLRTFLLNLVVIGTISVFWLTNPQKCWETALGQEVYRLFVTDFIISILVMGIVQTVQSQIQRKYLKEYGQPEFDIAWNTLNLIYNQTLFLVGFYFSPMLAVVIVIKLFITFHIKKAGALYNCQPPRKSWRAEQTQTLFLILTFITLLGVFLLFAYIVFKVPPSGCGPFRGFTFMYEAIFEKIFQQEKGNVFWQAISYIVKPGVVGGILIAMSIATYILRAKAQAHAIEADILKNMLINETRDKAFLFKHIKRAELMNQKKGSPALSASSSFHTPLSERRKLKRATQERQSSLLLTPSRGSKHMAGQRKYSSTSQIASTGWSYGRGNSASERQDEPSTSSGDS